MSFFFKILTLFYSGRSFLERKVFIKNIKKGDLVLDVGSGDKPFWRADVVVDKYLKDDQQRHSGTLLYDKRKIFLEADVENLPFKDKTFDFVFCSHLLEHVKNPDRAISELTRVAKNGYLEVPNTILELLAPFPPHLWYCSYSDDTLTFRQKGAGDNFFGDNVREFGKTIFNNSLFQYLLAKYINRIFISLYWREKINYKIIRVKPGEKAYQYREKQNKNKSLYLKISFLLYKIFYTVIVTLFYKKKKIKIKDLLAS